MSSESFRFRVACGWLRDLAWDPSPNDRWPCIRWDEQLLADQINFLEVQRELGVDHNVVWGLFVSDAWPVPFENVIDEHRRTLLKCFVEAAHDRGIRILAGTGIYSWGFDEVIRRLPQVAAGSGKVMCPHQPAAWDWQRRVLDFLMDPQWGLDGISMQSADQGRCQCERCSALSPGEYHANLLIRCAEHIRSQRGQWIIGQAAWGMRLDEPEEFPHIQRLSEHLDYMVEVNERSKSVGRKALLAQLKCAAGSVGGVFVEPPQHWDRLRWCVPCGLGSARSLRELYADGGRACEYFYRPFANPVEEVSWRTGAAILSSPQTTPEAALERAVSRVYGVSGAGIRQLADWFARAESAYFSRSNFQVGQGPLSLEPLVWKDNPAASGPPVYLRDRMSAEARADYARELRGLRSELAAMKLPNESAARKTLAAIDGTLADIASLAGA